MAIDEYRSPLIAREEIRAVTHACRMESKMVGLGTIHSCNPFGVQRR